MPDLILQAQISAILKNQHYSMLLKELIFNTNDSHLFAFS